MITKHNQVLHGETILRLLIPTLAAAMLLVSGCASHPSKHEPDPPAASNTAADTSQAGQPGQKADSTAKKTQSEGQAAAHEPSATPAIRKDAPLVYKVKKGDTLWDIAGYFLKDPWLWPDIWHDNPQVSNPHWIYPGDTLYLVKGMNGQYHVKLRPGVKRLEPQVRRMPLKAAISTIPIGAIKPFLHGPRVVPKEQLENAGYLVAFGNNQMLAQKGDTAYATGLGSHPKAHYEVVHPGEAYKDPKTDKLLGYKATPTARVKMLRPPRDGKAAVLNLTTSYEETNVGDRLLPLPRKHLRSGYSPHAPERAVSGQIIAAFKNSIALGSYQIVALNLGQSDGVNAGTVLGIYRPVKQVADPHNNETGGTVLLPRSKIGLLMVFKADQHLSHALIMQSTKEVHVGNRVQNPHSGNS